jgi:hypothetical protein
VVGGTGLGAILEIDTFSGGVVNTGTISAAAAGIVIGGNDNVEILSFSGGVTNRGKISAGTTGIRLGAPLGLTITGNVVNTGTISGQNGLALFHGLVSGAMIDSGTIVASGGNGTRGVAVSAVTAFSGGISNGGTITTGGSGIFVDGVKSFFGDISNSGKISAIGPGIEIDSSNISGAIVDNAAILGGGYGILVLNVHSFFGGIGNSGVISAAPHTGIALALDATFTGGISNRGTVAGGNYGITVDFGSIFSGGVLNSGTVRAVFGGIVVDDEALFSGGISNAGTVSVSNGTGIFVFNTATVVGDIANTGRISAPTGIRLQDGVLSGAIVERGTIRATGAGIRVDTPGKILSTKTAIAIAGGTFSGGVVNAGTISGKVGIDVTSVHGVSVFDGGTIVGSGGTAVEFNATSDTFTLGSGYVVSGNVIAAVSGDAFQLGGAAAANFDLAGVGNQYTGFTAFNVVGGTWTVSGSGSNWNVNGGTMELASGGTLVDTTCAAGRSTCSAAPP